MKTIELQKEVDRGESGVKCECGGYAERVELTPEEKRKYDCSSGCCGRAFVCVLCGNRYVGSAESPEMGEDRD